MSDTKQSLILEPSNALVGATGFVGQNLQSQAPFSAHYNSRNISDISGQIFDVIVCAAAPATMWQANKNPVEDLENINKLIHNLRNVKAKKFVLISTIAVLKDANGQENETTSNYETDLAYGKNRRYLEKTVADTFPQSHIVRLPALFGAGLKKNFLHDIINPIPKFLTADKYTDIKSHLVTPALKGLFQEIYTYDAALNMFAQQPIPRNMQQEQQDFISVLKENNASALSFTHPDSCFQYYNLANLWSDITKIIHADLPVVHLATPPLTANSIYKHLTQQDLPSAGSAKQYQEDMRTQYAHLWSAYEHYICNTARTLAEIKYFYEQESAR